jgi:hypothetical protein
MTRCYFIEGDTAIDKNAAGEEICVGCDWRLSEIPPTISGAEIGYDVDAYLAKEGQMLDLSLHTAHYPDTPDEATRVRISRWNRFVISTGESFESGVTAGEEHTERQLRDLWNRTPKD